MNGDDPGLPGHPLKRKNVPPRDIGSEYEHPAKLTDAIKTEFFLLVKHKSNKFC